MRRLAAGAALSFAVAGVFAMGTALHGQVQLPAAAAGRVVTVAGRTLVVTARPTTARTPRRTTAGPVAAFRPLSAAVKAELLRAAGLEAPQTSPASGGPFLLTPRAPYMEGRGWLEHAGATTQLWASQTRFDDLGDFLEVYAAGPTVTGYLVHLQVTTNDTFDYVVFGYDNTTHRVPAQPGKVQDILVLVQLPGASNSPTTILQVQASGPQPYPMWWLLGVEITPI